MADCGLLESDPVNPFQIKALFEIISNFADSLVSLDLSKNKFGSYFIENLPRVPNLLFFGLQGSLETQDELLSMVDKLDQQALPYEPIVDLLEPTQCISLSPGLRTMFNLLKTGGGTRPVILNAEYQVVQVDPVEPNHFFRRVLSDQHVPPNYIVVNLQTN